MTDHAWFEQLAGTADADSGDLAPARLKSKVYSSLVTAMAEAGPLLDLSEIKAAGEHLCVFEHLVVMSPVGPSVRSKNPCRVCHARILGEHVEHAPIFWPGCPYSEFHHG
jgi:hypothetical protein